MKAFMVASPATGSGKTTVTLALIAALTRRSLVVQSFKCGPDFIDTAHHTHVAGRSSRNLDSWMLDAHANREIFHGASQGADVAVTEAMMGLFDGVTGTGEQGSSAEIAKQLYLPVVLVLDASMAARSIAAVIQGFENFDADLKMVGVILNRVGSEGHLHFLQQAIAASCKSPVLGSLPHTPPLHIPERHLGLVTAAERPLSTEQVSLLADLAERHIDLDALLCACGDVASHVSTEAVVPRRIHNDDSAPKVRIGVPRDQAFCFYYEDNLQMLRSEGAEIVEFNSLQCSNLPAGLDALYFGGGYPELFAQQLSDNQLLIRDLHQFVSSGKPVYAECGGLIYLSDQLRTLDGRTFKMAGVLPLAIEMTSGLVHFGYTEVTFERQCLLGKHGAVARGHSFHYSKMLELGDVNHAYRAGYTLSGRAEFEGFIKDNVLASYIHLHFKSNPGLAASFVAHARAAREATLQL
ncbi:MAG TPA: cobyrinate a,c-diamide synthase [Terriglobales bacterium]|jgi:cobyrinic acid a,c-diamide synthase|nr:cobyrinate a,c-diamide synthase [Terriglobales bacterium]